MAYQSYYPLYAEDMCVPVTLEYEDDVFKANNAWIFGAFLLGLAVGIGITALLVPCTLRGLRKKKFACFKEQDQQELLDDEVDGVVTKTTVVKDHDTILAVNVREEDEYHIVPGKGQKKGKKLKPGSANKNDKDTNPKTKDDPFGGDDNEDNSDPAISHGIADILVQPTPEAAEAEMSKQDIDKLDRVIVIHRKEKDDSYLRQLKKELNKIRLPDAMVQEVVDTVIEDIRNKANVLQEERDEAKEELKKQKGTNTLNLEDQMEKIDSQYEQKMGRLHEDERDFIRSELSKKTDLTEDQIDALMNNLLKNMALMEQKLGNDFERQKRLLEERLAKRRQIMEFRNLQSQQEKDEIKDMVEVMDESAEALVKDGSLKQQQKDQIISSYMADLQRINREQDKMAEKNLQELAEKLRIRRIKRMNQLQTKHEKEKALFLQKNKNENKETMTAYLDLSQQQQEELEATEAELDQAEVQQIDILKQKLNSEKSTEIDHRTFEVKKQLEDAWVDPNKAQMIIDLHNAQMEKLNESRMYERQRMADKLREKWEKKMLQLDEEKILQQQQLDDITEQQTSTVNRVLSSSVELTEDAKKKILQEHAHNMQVLNNQLEKSKLKQQRHIEYRLNQRRAKMAEIRRQKEEAMLAKTKTSKAEQEKMEKQFTEEIAQQEAMIDKERKEALNALRRRMAQETEEALNQQERELGVLIGRLQIGSARRQAILQKQDAMIKNLEDQLEKKLSKGGPQLSGTDQIIMQYNNQVQQLNEQLQATRENQEYQIREKLQAKRLMKQQELNDDSELQSQTKEKQLVRRNSALQRGATRASDVLNKLFLSNKHERQLAELEEEIRIEQERSIEELNRQLEKELESELKTRKRNFLNELAVRADMSHDDLMDAVDSAVTETGGNKQQAKKLAKNLREGLQRAQTLDVSDEEDYGSRITSAKTRPKSGGKKKAKKATVSPSQAWGMSDNEDDF